MTMLKFVEEIYLQGKNIYLRAFSESDIQDKYIAWFNDPETSQFNSHNDVPYSMILAKKYHEQCREAKNRLRLAIVMQDGEHIGNIDLSDISTQNHNAELSLIIGEKKYWGRGYGLEACRLIMDYGFNALGLHRIHCGTFATNKAMIALATALGMHQEGLRMQAVFKGQRYVDICEFGILKEDFLIRKK